MKAIEDAYDTILENSLTIVRYSNSSLVNVSEKLRKIDEKLYFFAYHYLRFANQRLTFIYFLSNNGNRYDTQIIFRTFLECLTRLIYITYKDSHDGIKTALEEIFIDLSDIQFLRTSTNLAPLSGNTSFPQNSSNMWRAAKTTSEEGNEVRTRTTGKDRSRINHKYSFSEMVREISTSRAGPLAEFNVMLHSYNQASHIAHADLMGINLVEDFESREEDEGYLMSFAHRSSMISDATHLLTIAYKLIYSVVGDALDLAPINNHVRLMDDATKLINDAFYATQAHLYEASDSR